MNETFLYSEILSKTGWFDAGQCFEQLDRVNYVHYINEVTCINEQTVIAYFPGCFAQFHEGHLSVLYNINATLKAQTNNYLIVIAPANSDYTVTKYGADSVYASNKYRFDRIVKMLEGYKGNVAIDLNPMLNNDRDYNFTDLLKDFIERQGVAFENLVHAPYIMCGKDRKYFKNLELLTDKVRISYTVDCTQQSSSALIATQPKTFVKKTCLLRCNNPKQLEEFTHFFGHNYHEVKPIYLKEELVLARQLAKHADVTICKEYAEILPYVPFHRKFVHPLITNNTHEGDIKKLQGKLVLDSDIFTGGTQRAIENLGAHLVSVIDVSSDLERTEIVDFNDFYNDNYCYPHYDIAERCSMRPFTTSDHENLRWFKHVIQSISKEIV